MKLDLTRLAAVFMLCPLLSSGCTSTSMNQKFNGLSTPAGPPVGHINTSKYALHLLFGVLPFLGNASIEDALDAAAQKAKEAGADQIRIVQSQKTAYWFALPPISFVITPVVSNVAADALKSTQE